LSNRRVLRRADPAFLPKEREGGTNAAGLRLTVICSRWNPTVTDALLRSALAALEQRCARSEDVEVIRVPGAFELPAAAHAALAGRHKPDAVIVLGAIVRGETTHHEVLGHAVASALAALSSRGCPIGFGLLTCDTMEQARARTSKGREAAEAAIEMARLNRALLPKAKGKGRRAKGEVTGKKTLRAEAAAFKLPDHPIARSPDPGRR
jgi:6,7-dimethyl-8-ribityllumazine synthase